MQLAPVLLTLFAIIVAPPAVAADVEVPDPLRDWVAWVGEELPERRCPYFHGRDDRQCVWISHAILQLDGRGGRFELTGEAHADAWLVLPGSRRHWPGSVTRADAAGQPPLLVHRERPAIRVAPGPFRIEGRFAWQHLPNALSLPPTTGIVTAFVDGQPIAINRDAQGGLWLRDRAPTSSDQTRDRLDIKVHRRIDDLAPMRVDTQLVLEVAGRQREIVLPTPLLAEFIPIDLRSKLPARIEPDGTLRVQLRPGRHEILVTAYRPDAVTALARPARQPNWPDDEVWVFQARNQLRLVEPEGPPQIDPRQTTLPPNWQNLPAFVLADGQTLNLKVRRRGDPEPEPDRLSLERTLWLDFDGGGYTVQDLLTGTITRTWRLETAPQLALGRVAVDGNNQLVTTRPGSDLLGVEVRRGALSLTADSRYAGDPASLPLGWRHDLNSARATLHLPPGWDVFSVSGVDNNPPSWIQRWTLLDLFLVLIASLAIAKLWGLAAGCLALATLALTWHAPGAPHQVWLHVVAALALLRVMPQGRLRMLVAGYRNLALLVLVVIAIPFMVMQARTGVYPQLGEGRYVYQSMGDLTPRTARVATRKGQPGAPAELAVEESFAADAEQRRGSKLDSYRGGLLNQALDFQRIDPKANVQTGPGLPTWQWRTIPLSWSGPVASTQIVELTLLGPWQNRLLNFMRMLLMFALVVLLIRDRSTGGPKTWLRQLGVRREPADA